MYLEKTAIESCMVNTSTFHRRPDLVLVSGDSIYLFELTLPKEYLSAARAQKEDRYGSLLYDLKCTGLVVGLIPIEIS